MTVNTIGRSKTHAVTTFGPEGPSFRPAGVFFLAYERYSGAITGHPRKSSDWASAMLENVGRTGKRQEPPGRKTWNSGEPKVIVAKAGLDAALKD